ncbi:MAG: polar amino acid transport system substrate-binding protein [Alteromonadaceae bacterium]|jgi:polar amino acid transport system substrate-binding protein
MVSVCKSILIFFLLCNVSTAYADSVLMAFSHNIPPYIFEKKDKGIEIDIIAAALAYKGHSLKPRYFPLSRIPLAFKGKWVDAAMGDMGVDLIPHGGFYANPTIIYENVFITLKNQNIVIGKPEDLDSLTIVSFQGAEKRYKSWLEKANNEKRFYGTSNQYSQVKLLYFKRYDVVLSDRYIFKYFLKQLQLTDDAFKLSVDEHKFITANPLDYRPIFRDKKVRDDFNEGLQAIKKSGEFKKIYDKYMN